jgi:hypothetical protein
MLKTKNETIETSEKYSETSEINNFKEIREKIISGIMGIYLHLNQVFQKI